MIKSNVLISIVNWCNYEETINCIQQLNNLKYNLDHLVIIDNHSKNNSISKLRNAFPYVEIIESPINNGYAAGHKIAVEFAIKNNFDLLWILNPDVILNENTLSALVDAYNRNGPAIYGSISVNEKDTDTIEFGGAYELINGRMSADYIFRKGTSLSELKKTSAEYQVGAVEGFSMLIPLDVIRKYGFMDIRFFMYGEEIEYCLMLQEKGIPSYIVTDSVIVHKGEGSFQKSEWAEKIIAYYRARNYRLIAKKYFGLTNYKILKNIGGIKALAGFFIKWIFAGKKFRMEKVLDYFHNLGILHALFNSRGKKIRPEKYL